MLLSLNCPKYLINLSIWTTFLLHNGEVAAQCSEEDLVPPFNGTDVPKKQLEFCDDYIISDVDVDYSNLALHWVLICGSYKNETNKFICTSMSLITYAPEEVACFDYDCNEPTTTNVETTYNRADTTSLHNNEFSAETLTRTRNNATEEIDKNPIERSEFVRKNSEEAQWEASSKTNLLKQMDLNFNISSLRSNETELMNEEVILLDVEEKSDELSVLSTIEKAMAIEMRNIEDSQEFTMEDLDRLMNPKMEFLAECQFNQQLCYLQRDVVAMLQWKYGVCYSFNANNGSKHLVDQKSVQSGLRLMINTKTEDYLPTTLRGGIKVLVHDAEKFPFVDSYGLLVSAGSDSMMQIELTQMSRASVGNRQCLDAPLGNYNYYKEAKYSYEGCSRSFLQERTLVLCGCCNPELAIKQDDINVTVCSPNNTCMVAVSSNIEESFKKSPCVMDCRTNHFNIEISNSMMLNEFVSYVHGVEASNVVRLQIKLKTFLIVAIVEHPAMEIENIFWAFCQIAGLSMGITATEMLALTTLVVQMLVDKICKCIPSRKFQQDSEITIEMQ